MNGAPIISNGQLLLSLTLLFLPGAVSTLLGLGLLKSLLWGALRTFLQLSFIGYVLGFLFTLENPLVVVAVVTAMTAIATEAAMARTPSAKPFPYLISFGSLWASTFLAGTIVLSAVIAADPWYSPRVAIPIFGMILGNAMTGISLALERLFSSVREGADSVEALLALGATPWESVRDRVRQAIGAGMTPTIHSLMVVGLVSLPGMMTGQILGGADPLQAVRYQIVVMYMISAAVAVGCLLLTLSGYRRLFTEDGALRPDLRESARP